MWYKLHNQMRLIGSKQEKGQPLSGQEAIRDMVKETQEAKEETA